MSFNHLKERLSKLKKRSEDTFTFDITDAKKWIKVNSPEEWLEYIQHVKENVEFPSDLSQFRFLSQLYDKAFQDINSACHKNNESYAKLFVSHGRMLSAFVPEDAIMIFHQARAICRRFSMVHIASAQLEIDRGNPGKAKKILEKALLFEAMPKEDLLLAMKNMDQGDHLIFKSPPVPRNNYLESRLHKGSTSSDSSEELHSMSHLTDNISANLSVGLSVSFQHRHDLQNKPEVHPKQLPSSVQKHTMRPSRSTPLLNSEKRRRNLNILPRRVKKIDLPFDPMMDEEEEMNTMDSFKPLDNTKGVSFNAHAHTSGYLSMIADSTIPMDTKPPEMPVPPKEEVIDVIPIIEPTPVKSVIPTPFIAETPCNKGITPQPVSTPMPNMDVITVNDVQYAVLGLLGKGGSSKVYQVFDGKIKAIKCVDLNNANDIIVEGYKNEIKLLKRLQYCDKVIKMYDSEYKQEENKLHVVMEAGNDDLATFFRSQTKNRKPLSDNLIRFYWEIMLEAVQALHKEDLQQKYEAIQKLDKGIPAYKVAEVLGIGTTQIQNLHKRKIEVISVFENNVPMNTKPVLRDSLSYVTFLRKSPGRSRIIHSDLKPANFLLVGGILKLIDFGIAKALQQDKTSVILETQIGTLNYMSPEAIMDSCGDAEEGKPQFKISVKSDVWSLGCILYNMVYGRTPFQNLRNDFIKLQAIMNPDFPIQFPDIPNVHLIDVMKRCLNRNPKQRPSIDDLLSHSYLKASKEEHEATSPPVKEKLNDKKVEALINTLSEQYALSPGGIRNLIHKTMDTSQKTPDCIDNKIGDSGKQSVEALKPVNPLKSLLQGNKPEPHVKHIRTPLTSLNLHDLHGKSHDPVERQRQSSGT